MTSLKQNIKTILTDVETFLVETLKSVKLNSSAKDSKDRLLEKVRQLLEEITGSSSGQLDSSASGGSHKISGGGDSGSGSGSASNLQSTGGEESGYGEDITKIAASDLKNKLQAGLLERKKKSGFKSWEQVYCVVSNNIFYIYKKQGDSKQKGAFCLNGYEFQAAPDLEKDASKKEMCFELVKAGAHTYQFRAASVEGMTHWQEAITKGIQMVADEEDGETYDAVEQDNSSGGNFPPPPPDDALFEDPDDIYEECNDNVEPPPPSQPPPVSEPQPEPEAPDDIYDDCASATQADEKEAKGEAGKASVPPPPPLPPSINKRREPPPIPPSSDPPPPPPPKADLPAIPKSIPPPIPERRPSTADLPPPPLPGNPPPVPSRGAAAARVPQLRQPFMDREEDFENIFLGKWDCAADSNKELAFKQGDMIHVLSRDFDAESWWVGELEGRIGLVPKEYLCPAFELVA